MKRPEKEGGHTGKYGHQKLTSLIEATQAVSASQPKSGSSTDRLAFVLCQSVQSTLRVERALCEIADKLDSLLALAQQRNDLIRKERSWSARDELPVTNLVQRLDAKRNGAGWKAKCPAHDDRVPSLSINKGEDGRVLLKCHRGCAIDDILIAIGWTKKDLFPANDRAGNSGPVAVYDYTDEDGELLFQVCRFEPKDFRQRRPDGNGGWIWSTRDVRRVLYQLPKIVAAQRVAIAEGEKDCNAITKSGIVATCNSWRRW